MITDILLQPIHGTFDLPTVEAELQRIPHTARDQHNPHMFMIAESASDLAAAQAERRRDPTRFPTTVILVDTGDTRIDISYRKSRVAPARQFVEWLRQHYQLTYLDDAFNDLTPHVTTNLDFLFGTP